MQVPAPSLGSEGFISGLLPQNCWKRTKLRLLQGPSAKPMSPTKAVESTTVPLIHSMEPGSK